MRTVVAPDEVSPTPLLEVANLRTWYRTRRGVVRAVDGVSFSIGAGEVLGMVGESGSGKSQTARSILGLITRPGWILDDSSIRFQGAELTQLSEPGLRRIRGADIAMIYQHPRSALNPVYTVGQQIAETVVAHQNISWADARKRAVELLNVVRVPDPVRRSRQYPHELSGGLCQRVAIAIALSNSPKLLVADEPTTALDVTIQAQILELLLELTSQLRMAMLFITHDLAVVGRVADDVAVMYAGRIIERGAARDLLRSPQHPYSEALLDSASLAAGPGSLLATIPGSVPDPTAYPDGCRFAPRCSYVFERCKEYPSMIEIGVERRFVSCWLCEAGPRPSVDPGHDRG